VAYGGRQGVPYLVGLDSTLIVVGGIIMLVAGMMIVGAVQDAIDQFYVTASARVFEVFMRTAGIVAGIVIALRLAQNVGAPLSISANSIAFGPPWAQFTAVGLIAGFFTISVYADAVTVLLAVGMALVAWLGYTSTVDVGVGEVVGDTVGALLAAVLTTLIVRRTHVPGFGLITPPCCRWCPGSRSTTGCCSSSGPGPTTATRPPERDAAARRQHRGRHRGRRQPRHLPRPAHRGPGPPDHPPPPERQLTYVDPDGRAGSLAAGAGGARPPSRLGPGRQPSPALRRPGRGPGARRRRRRPPTRVGADLVAGLLRREGRAEEPVEYRVLRVDEAVRRVTARQSDRPILILDARFDGRRRGAAVGARGEPPDPAWRPGDEDGAAFLVEQARRMPFELRFAGLPSRIAGLRGEVLDGQRFWFRAAERLPDSLLSHACALTYISDLFLVSVALARHGLPGDRRGPRSRRPASTTRCGSTARPGPTTGSATSRRARPRPAVGVCRRAAWSTSRARCGDRAPGGAPAGVTFSGRAASGSGAGHRRAGSRPRTG
jgi:uncharacterized membrane protein YjjB (DUF3815 family)